MLMLWLCGAMVISMADSVPFLSAGFETASALGTVGLTTGITPALSRASHIVLILLMYIGRVGGLSMSIAFLTGRKVADKIKYPEFHVMIG